MMLCLLGLFICVIICLKLYRVYINEKYKNPVCANCRYAKKLKKGETSIRVCHIDREVLEIIEMAESEKCANWKHKWL